MSKACCGFGHREVFEDISEKIYSAVKEAAEQGCDVFYTGGNGEFDELYSSAVRKLKTFYPNIKLILVKPYLTKKINDIGGYLYTLYDDIIIPTELADAHYKSIIKKRNRLIVDWCSVVIVYVKREYGGAFDAMKYAEKQSETIIKRI